MLPSPRRRPQASLSGLKGERPGEASWRERCNRRCEAKIRGWSSSKLSEEGSVSDASSSTYRVVAQGTQGSWQGVSSGCIVELGEETGQDKRTASHTFVCSFLFWVVRVLVVAR